MTVELNPDGSYPELCPTCGVDHRWTMADLSHGNIALMLHAQERFTWMEFEINGDMIARQRAGILDGSLLYSTTDPQEIDWDYINARQHEGDPFRVHPTYPNCSTCDGGGCGDCA